jgi:BTB/POZ domain
LESSTDLKISTMDDDRNTQKPLVGSEGELDAVVVVGGQEFLEHSGHLSYWSRYFEAAMRSGMKESQTKRFEFPDRTPDEWELLKKILHPFDAAKVEIDSCEAILSWCDELLMPSLMAECDRVISEYIQGAKVSDQSKVFSFLASSFRHGLQLSVPMSISYIRGNLSEFPSHFTLDQLTVLTTLCLEYDQEGLDEISVISSFPYSFIQASSEKRNKGFTHERN